MTEVYLIELGRKAFSTTLLICGPILGFGMLVGLLVSIFQAVTTIQEMTLTFVPKIFTVMIVIALFGPWMLTIMVRFTYDILTHLPTFTR